MNNIEKNRQLPRSEQLYTTAIYEEAVELINEELGDDQGHWLIGSKETKKKQASTENVRIDIQGTYDNTENNKRYANIQVQINNPLAKQLKKKPTTIAHLQMLTNTKVPDHMARDAALKSLN